MDPIIINNTKQYIKAYLSHNVSKAIEKDKQDNLIIKKIYIVKKEESSDPWRAILIDSQCQGGKTKKCFEILSKKIKNFDTNTLVLFVTQANSNASVNQVLQRAKNCENIQSIIPSNNIFKSNNIPDDISDGNYMVADFWNSRNMDNMLTFVKNTNDNWGSIVIVVDEVEQAGLKGVKDRLTFIRNVEKSAPDSIINVIFITATTANLSKCILAVAKANLVKFNTGVVNEIINKRVVEHHYATPHSTYVGASWFQNTPNVWKKMTFAKKSVDMTKDEYTEFKQDEVLAQLKILPDVAKELSLIVTSTRTDDHQRIAERLYRIGYNVTVELNGKFNKNYKVNYINKSGGISTWMIPYSQIDANADNGDLETFWTSSKIIYSGIEQKEDYTLSHILQAALFMRTSAQDRIKQNVSEEEYNRLDAISNGICNLHKSLRRPNDYPSTPRVAMVAGHLAGRGITIQNPALDFTCTSFCFTDTKDAVQRGATNTQRFGRACGMLGDVFARKGRQPILIATEGIIKNAVANEMALIEKAEAIENGTQISLKDLISQADWTKIMKKATDSLKTTKYVKIGDEDEDGVSFSKLKCILEKKTTIVSKMITYLQKANKKLTFVEFKNGIKYSGSDKQFQNNIDNGRGIKCIYGKLWINENNYIEMNPNIKKYINQMIK